MKNNKFHLILVLEKNLKKQQHSKWERSSRKTGTENGEETDFSCMFPSQNSQPIEGSRWGVEEALKWMKY